MKAIVYGGPRDVSVKTYRMRRFRSQQMLLSE